MLPPDLEAYPVAAALDMAVPGVILTGKSGRGELSLEIQPERIVAACASLKRDQQFVRLSSLTGVDFHPAEPRFEVVYHLHSPARNQRVRLKCRVSEEIDSVTVIWRSANWYERETWDLFGIRFRNHPDLRRIMMPEDWKGHPLRKDYPITGDRV